MMARQASKVGTNFSLTPRFSGVVDEQRRRQNRFNGFDGEWQTVETVNDVRASLLTPLKQGVNEKPRSTANVRIAYHQTSFATPAGENNIRG
jgi:hypothetical protein